MKKSFRTLTSLAALFAVVSLGGCRGGSGDTPVAEGPEVKEILPNRHALALFTGETFELSIRTLPKTSEAPVLRYRTGNAKVATIQDGVITAKGPGICKVYIDNSDRSVTEEITVYVNNADMKSSAGKKLGKAIANGQIDHPMSDIIYVNEIYDGYRTKNDVVQTTTWFDQDLIVSKENAYLYLYSHDYETHCEGGGIEETSSAWYMYTTASYDTYLFHVDGKLKTYMVVDTTSFIGKARYLALYDVLENLFVSGKAIVTNQYEDYAGSSPLNSYVSSAEKIGSLGDGNISFDLHASYDDEVVEPADEEDYEIPAGTTYTLTINNKFAFNDYYCAVKDIEQGMLYKLNGDDYVDMVKATYHYQVASAEDLIYPDYTDGWEKVDSVYDL